MTKEARMDWVRWVLWKARNKIWQTWSDYQMQSCGQFRRPFCALVSACGCSMSSFIYDAILSIDFFMYIAQGVFFIPFPYLPTRKMRNTYKYEKARFRSPGYLIVIDDKATMTMMPIPMKTEEEMSTVIGQAALSERRVWHPCPWWWWWGLWRWWRW